MYQSSSQNIIHTEFKKMVEHSDIIHVSAHGSELCTTINLIPGETVIMFYKSGCNLLWSDELDKNLWDISQYKFDKSYSTIDTIRNTNVDEDLYRKEKETILINNENI